MRSDREIPGQLTLHTCELLYSPESEIPERDRGLIVDDEGRIIRIAARRELHGSADREVHHQILMPAVVNAHIHLTDAARTEIVPGGDGLIRWVGKLTSDRSGGRTVDERRVALRSTLEEMREAGTGLIGEVVNDAGTIEAIREADMPCRLIHELIAFRLDRLDGMLARTREVELGCAASEAEAGSGRSAAYLRYTIGSHAPYSVSPELMTAIVVRNRAAGRPTFQHLAEDPDERILYERGEGPWREFLEAVGAWEAAWHGVGMSPIALYDSLGLFGSDFVAVHLTDATEQEIRLLANRGAGAVLSPTSNLHITERLPLVDQMVECGMRLGLGTDGRGSNPSMNVFDEAVLLQHHFPMLPPGTLLRALTAGGAELLGFPEFGRIREGTSPGLVSVESGGPNLAEMRGLERGILADGAVRRRVV